ncbi:MAG TPA: hypothetical protein VI854_08265 [Acidimicrobiia bacterium]|nr:hypothetical protein [Acidimicrobiia bacterium]
MHSSPTDPLAPSGVTAAKTRHPAGRALDPARTPVGPLSFTGAVGLLIGPWRVGDPQGFAAAMTGAASVAGHPVTDAAGDTLLPAPVEAALAGAAQRPLGIHWVAATQNGRLYVEARAQAAATMDGPEVFVIAHLVEGVAGGRRGAAPGDHSWVVVLIGNGSGAVRAVVRAVLGCQAGPRRCPRPPAHLRLPLTTLRERLLAPALEAALPPRADTAVVLPFRPRR